MEIFSQLFQGSVTVLIGGQEFSAQIILVCLCHTRLGHEESPKYSLHYLLKCFTPPLPKDVAARALQAADALK